MEIASHNRKCIDGHITGCGKCVGYCSFVEHSGYLTAKLRKEHNCIKKGCWYYQPKVTKQEITFLPYQKTLLEFAATI